MDKLMEMTQEVEMFLYDCVATGEVIRCMQEKGVEAIDSDGVSLKPEVFDRCFPGVEWREVRAEDGEFIGLYEKTAEYRGFEFGTYKEADTNG